MEDVYHLIYFECLNLVVSCIRDRFNQPGYAVLRQLEDLLLKAVKGECYQEELGFVMQLHKNDITHSSLDTQLEIVPVAINPFMIFSMLQFPR